MDSLLQSIRDDLLSFPIVSKDNNLYFNKDIHHITRNVITNINKAQQDPSLLERHASFLLTILSRRAIPIFQVNDVTTTDELFQSLSEVFYNFAKVLTWKRAVIHLRSDIFLLPNILLFLSYYTRDPHREANLWQANYFLLSWLYVLLISPFSFQQHDVDSRIIRLLKKPSLSGNIFVPIVAKIRSELYYRNHKIFTSHYSADQIIETYVDMLSLNDFLKKIERNPNEYNRKFLVENQLLLQSIVSRYLDQNESSDGNISLLKARIMPKFLYLLLLYQDWSHIKTALAWYIRHLNSPVTEFRFVLAHSFFKAVSLITEQITDLEDNFCVDLVENRIIDGTIELLDDTLVDVNALHSNLLIIAELAPFIKRFLPIEYTEKIVNLILPKTFCFQQMGYSNKISTKSSGIKDASNFVVWSLVRTTRFGADNKFLKFLNTIFNDSIFVSLVVNSLFDRDFAIRKSSNAALQEYLGRVRGDHMVDNEVKIKLIELKIGALTHSYENNLAVLGRILGTKYRTSMKLVLNWLIKFNILQNYDLNIVRLSVVSLRNYSLEPMVDRFSLQFAGDTVQSLVNSLNNSCQRQIDRILYLLTEVSSVLKHLTIDPIILVNSIRILTKSRYHNTKNDQDFFKYLAVLKAWKLLLHTHINANVIGDNNDKNNDFQFHWDISDINFLFDKILFDVNHSKVCRWGADFTSTFGELLIDLTKNPKFSSPDTLPRFWKKYDGYIKANNTIVCSTLPYLSAEVFLSKLNKYRSTLSCPARVAVLQTLIEIDPRMIIDENSKVFFEFIFDSLDDHTVTIQGDVGSKVRAKACEFTKCKFDLIPSQFHKKLMNQLLYLSVEPSDLVGNIALGVLIDHFTESGHLHSDNGDREISRYGTALELWDRLASEEDKPEFLVRYALSGGSVHAVDTELRDSIDSFIRWYVIRSDCVKQAVFHDIIEAIPSATLLVRDKKGRPERIKLIITALNFLMRLISSRVRFVCNDWDRVLKKLQDLVNLKLSKVLKSTIIQFLPFLAFCSRESSPRGDGDWTFVNKTIKMIKLIIEQEAKTDNSGFTKLAIESLLQLLLQFEQDDKVTRIQRALEKESDDPVALCKISDMDLCI